MTTVELIHVRTWMMDRTNNKSYHLTKDIENILCEEIFERVKEHISNSFTDTVEAIWKNIGVARDDAVYLVRSDWDKWRIKLGRGVK